MLIQKYCLTIILAVLLLFTIEHKSFGKTIGTLINSLTYECTKPYFQCFASITNKTFQYYEFNVTKEIKRIIYQFRIDVKLMNDPVGEIIADRKLGFRNILSQSFDYCDYLNGVKVHIDKYVVRILDRLSHDKRNILFDHCPILPEKYYFHYSINDSTYITTLPNLEFAFELKMYELESEKILISKFKGSGNIRNGVRKRYVKKN